MLSFAIPNLVSIPIIVSIVSAALPAYGSARVCDSSATFKTTKTVQ